MNVLACGTKVIITDVNVEGTITAVCLRFEATAYEVTYFVDRKKEELWLHESQFTFLTADRTTIGFIKQS